jgi:hypothetical protein
LITDAGRSTTSPAAILLMVLSSKTWIRLMLVLPPACPVPVIYKVHSWPLTVSWS